MKWDEEDFLAEEKHDQRWKVFFQGPSDSQSGFAEGRVCFQDNNMELERDHVRKDSKEQVGDFIFQ